MRRTANAAMYLGLGLLLLQSPPAMADQVLLDPKMAQLVVGMPGGKSVLAALGEETPSGSGYFKILYPPMPPTGSGNPCAGAVLSPAKGLVLKKPTPPLPVAASPASAGDQFRSAPSSQYVSAGECLLKALSADHPPTQLPSNGLERFRVVQTGGSNGGAVGGNPALAGASQVGDAAWTEAYQIAYFRPEVVSAGASASVSASAAAVAPQATTGALVSAGSAASSLALGTAASVAITAGVTTAVIGSVVASEDGGGGTTATVSTTATTR